MGFSFLQQMLLLLVLSLLLFAATAPPDAFIHSFSFTLFFVLFHLFLYFLKYLTNTNAGCVLGVKVGIPKGPLVQVLR